MRAAYILKKEFGYETRILNIHTLKPIDAEAIIRAACETGATPRTPVRTASGPRSPTGSARADANIPIGDLANCWTGSRRDIARFPTTRGPR